MDGVALMGVRTRRDKGSASRVTSRFTASKDLVKTTLAYPMVMNTGANNSDNFSLQFNAVSPGSQKGLEIQDSSGNTVWMIPPAGGPKALNHQVRAYHSDDNSGSYISLDGTATMPSIIFPDGVSSQGSRMFFGQGLPTDTFIDIAGATVNNVATSVGTPTVGDFYIRSDATACTMIALSATKNAGTTVTSFAVGNSPSLTNAFTLYQGEPAVGDLLVVVVCNTVASESMTIGSATGITDTSTDGGIAFTDGTRIVHMMSRVLVSGDLTGSGTTHTVGISALTNNAGGNRNAFAYVFRNYAGWPVTGKGCTLFASGKHPASGTSSTSPVTVTATGPTARDYVAVCAAYQGSSNPASPYTFVWDGGPGTTTTADTAGPRSFVSARPGLLGNTSNRYSAQPGGSSVVVTNSDGVREIGLGLWSPNAPTAPGFWLYRCSVSGAPGTWVGVI